MKTYTDSEQDAFVERMIPFYKKHIRESLQWDQIHTEFEEPVENWDGEPYSASMLGSVFSIMPSGKYWTFWDCGNMTREEMIKDTAFTKALNEIAEENDCWIESGEDDLCNLFICKGIESGQ